MDLEIPAQFQLLTALIIGALVAIGAVYKFFTDLRRDDPPQQQDFRLLGAAIGDSQAIDGIRDELREMRALMQRHLDVDRSADIASAMKEVAAALRGNEHAPRPPRR